MPARTRLQRSGHLATLAAFVVILGACSSDGAGTSDVAPTVEFDDAAFVVRYPSTLNDLILDASHSHTYVEVRDSQAGCLRERGWELRDDPAVPSGIQRTPDQLLVGDRGFIEQWGYGVAPAFADSDTFFEQFGFYNDPIQDLHMSIPSAGNDGTERSEYREVLSDIDDCLRSTLLEQRGAFATADMYDFVDEQEQTLESSADYEALVEEWRICIQADGLTTPADQVRAASTRNAAAASATERVGLAEVEIDLALTDYECRDTVDFTNRFTALAQPSLDAIHAHAETIDPSADDIDLSRVEGLQ